jgi:LPXTG-motif cell wall-anchored protein
MKGEQMRKMLHKLADNFYEVAVPAHGRYTREPAITDEGGVTYIPKPVNKISPAVAIAAGVAVLGLTAWLLLRKKNKPTLG